MGYIIGFYLAGVIISFFIFLTWAKNGGLFDGEHAVQALIFVFLTSLVFPYYWYVIYKDE
jgi:hypothetical protein